MITVTVQLSELPNVRCTPFVPIKQHYPTDSQRRFPDVLKTIVGGSGSVVTIPEYGKK